MYNDAPFEVDTFLEEVAWSWDSWCGVRSSKPVVSANYTQSCYEIAVTTSNYDAVVLHSQHWFSFVCVHNMQITGEWCLLSYFNVALMQHGIYAGVAWVWRHVTATITVKQTVNIIVQGEVRWFWRYLIDIAEVR